MTDENRPEANEEELIDAVEANTEDPIGDETDSEGEVSIESEADDAADAVAEAEEEAETEAQAETPTDEDASEEPEFTPKPRPPAKLERLQKILAQAGVASRRKAEEMIEQGRVQVNGKIVTELGTKADAGRDHIRVDGKLLQGSERLRYFVLNKPRGFVTTVKDPEGRPTVMQFFEKMRERLYPVGRLDYMSEGLLLVTNDGELANKLTRASAGVEKTYLVKVAGIPSEAELDILRAGVAIEKGKPGSTKVRTSPARIRQVRQGDNPWYEVVLIEGRNRELRKMFEEVGHFVEKIRRVGYGPLILDQEPGNFRELDANELDLLKKTADGKLKTPKAKEIRRRNMIDSLPPEKAPFKPRGERPAAGPKDYVPKKAFGTDRPTRTGSGPARFEKPESRFEAGRPSGAPPARPAWKKDDRASGPSSRPPARFAADSTGEGRPAAGRTFGSRPSPERSYGPKPPSSRPYGARPSGARPASGRSFGDRPSAGRGFPPKPAWKKPESSERPAYKESAPYKDRPPYKKPFAPRPEATRRPAPEPIDDLGPRKSFKLHIEPVQDSERTQRPKFERPSGDRSRPDRPRFDRQSSDRPRPDSNRTPSSGGRFGGGATSGGRSGFGHSGSIRSGAGPSRPARPFRSEGGLARPFTTSSGKPRPGGARPSSKPGKDSGRSFGDSTERRTGGWKPKPSFGGKPKSSGGGSSRPKSGGPSRSGYKGKPGGGSGAKRSGPRPGGKKRS